MNYDIICFYVSFDIMEKGLLFYNQLFWNCRNSFWKSEKDILDLEEGFTNQFRFWIDP